MRWRTESWGSDMAAHTCGTVTEPFPCSLMCGELREGPRAWWDDYTDRMTHVSTFKPLSNEKCVDLPSSLGRCPAVMSLKCLVLFLSTQLLCERQQRGGLVSAGPAETKTLPPLALFTCGFAGSDMCSRNVCFAPHNRQAKRNSFALVKPMTILL